MRINTNIAALNSYNQLNNTQDNLSKSLERLSSGKRINGASDDAAGLAISEKMTGQVRGLGQAQRNAQDAISMNQTAEGALKESHSILQRMRELAVQSANDTNTEADRAEIQEEVNQLSEELTRIGETTEFNTQKLLNGELKNIFQIGSNEAQNMELDINDMRADALGVAGDGEGDANFEIEASEGLASGQTESDVTDKTLKAGENELEVVEFDGAQSVSGEDMFFGLENGDGEIVAVADADADSYNFLDEAVSLDSLEAEGSFANYDSDSGRIQFAESVKTGEVTIEDVSLDDSGNVQAIAAGDITATASVETEGLETGKYEIEGEVGTTSGFDGTESYFEDYSMTTSGSDEDLVELVDQVVLDEDGELAAVSFTEDGTDGVENTASGEFFNIEDIDLEAKNYDGTDTYQDVVAADVEPAMTTESLEDGDTVEIKAEGGIDVSSQDAADKAITTIDDAISQVSSERSKLGAVQNRLEHTINNLNTAEENLTAAESRISDVDMAQEMMGFTKNQILSQAGTAMMAQANQLPQGVLQLLG